MLLRWQHVVFVHLIIHLEIDLFISKPTNSNISSTFSLISFLFVLLKISGIATFL